MAALISEPARNAGFLERRLNDGSWTVADFRSDILVPFNQDHPGLGGDLGGGVNVDPIAHFVDHNPDMTP